MFPLNLIANAMARSVESFWGLGLFSAALAALYSGRHFQSDSARKERYISRMLQINVERGPTKSERVEVEVMTGRKGFWIGKTCSGSLSDLLGQHVAIIIRQGFIKQGDGYELICKIPGVPLQSSSSNLRDILVYFTKLLQAGV